MLEKYLEALNFVDVDFGDSNILNQKPHRVRRCPVVVTIDDSLMTHVDIQQLLEAGMNVAKLRMYNSTRESRIALLKNIEKAAANCCVKYGVNSWPIATCVELKTFIVRTGILETDDEFITIKKKSYVILTNNLLYYDKCNEERIFVDNIFLTKDIKVGTEIYIAFDEIILTCTAILDDHSIRCHVLKGGHLTSICNVCAREITHSRPFLNKRDLEILRFALEFQIDMVTTNYTPNSKCIKKLKKTIGKTLKKPIILCGIATNEGLANIEEISMECDGIVISREFLACELSIEYRNRLPNIQKWMAAKCFQAGKPFFISGGVFSESLKTGSIKGNEISDFTNAILDGASGFFLKDCIDTDTMVEILTNINDISHVTDPLATSKSGFWRLVDEVKPPVNAALATILSCAAAANQTKSQAIIIPTVSGKTVKDIHWLRPSCLIIAISSEIRVVRLLHAYRGVVALLYNGPSHSNWQEMTEAHMNFAIEYAIKRYWVEYGSFYVSLQRSSQFCTFCDLVRINKVSTWKKSIIQCPATDESTLVSRHKISI